MRVGFTREMKRFRHTEWEPVKDDIGEGLDDVEETKLNGSIKARVEGRQISEGVS
jgi:hypothetical protein